MNHLERIIDDSYVPTNDDIIRARQRTTGANITRFSESDTLWEIIDVGGQKPEREKWGRIIKEGIQGVIFFSSIDEYNIGVPIEAPPNCSSNLEFSMDIFESITETLAGNISFMVVFFNKMDKFEEKMKTEEGLKDFFKAFPEFKARCKKKGLSLGDDLLIESALEYLEMAFDNRAPDSLDLVFYRTCALDTNQLSNIFSAIKGNYYASSLQQQHV
eukprot:TRINITY_DN192_c0_g1_i2.p1 TRINITY_DN192_c0_g1~~TRINITY_DN192_c0_g1_i2.p1  ORF type:complete len:216 (-),score=49.11 TRINITY_DN192_c0_g1_i2:22-669(-)